MNEFKLLIFAYNSDRRMYLFMKLEILREIIQVENDRQLIYLILNYILKKLIHFQMRILLIAYRIMPTIHIILASFENKIQN